MSKPHKQNFLQRYFSNRASREHEAFVKAVLKDLTVGSRRTELFNTQGMDGTVELPWDYKQLYDIYQNDPVVRTVGDSIIRELLRPRGANRAAYSIQPRWLRKCPECGNEFQSEVERCPDCKHSNGVHVSTVKPKVQQRQTLKAFLDDPNLDDEMQDIVESAYHYMFSVGDWYLSMQRGDQKQFKPFTVYNEDSRFMKVAADTHGGLGNNQWFCPLDKTHPERVFHSKDAVCPEHPDAELKETAYLYVDGTLKARFAKDEVCHGKPSAWLPSLYSYSPLITCLLIIYSIKAMNLNNFDIYDEGKLGNILCLPLKQEEATKIAEAIEQQRNIPKWDSNKGRWVIKKLRTLILGTGVDGKSATNVPAMPESEKMQSLEWWKLWKTVVCASFGVQDIYAGAVAEGTTGQNPRMKVDVNNDAVEYWGSKFEGPFNNVVVAQGLGVTDWILKFNPVEEKDEMQDITILSTKLDVMKKAVELGLQVEFTDEGEVKVAAGEPLSLDEKQTKQLERFQKMNPQQQPQGNAPFGDKQPFKQEQVFSKEKAKEKWIVTKVNQE